MIFWTLKEDFLPNNSSIATFTLNDEFNTGQSIASDPGFEFPLPPTITQGDQNIGRL
jgi:hypothetical protein